MKTIISYPPKEAYPYMPYLGPFLLKGYIEANSQHSVTTHDLNIEYYRFLWVTNFGTEAAMSLENCGKTQYALMAELLAEKGIESWKALRNYETYHDVEAVRAHAFLLDQADILVEQMDRQRGLSGSLPSKLGEWEDLLDGWENSVVGKFLHLRLTSGIYDNADIVGISVSYIQQLIPGLLLARTLKQRNPDILVFLGGNVITHYLPEMLKDHSLWANIDYAIPYEGEYSLHQLLDQLETGITLPPTNVAYFEDNKVVYNQELADRPNIEAIPDFSDLEHLYPTPTPIYPILTSKGCYWGKCKFCTHHEGYGQGFHRFSDDLVASTVRKLVKEKEARYFYFVDEALPSWKLTNIASIFEELTIETTEPREFGWMAEARLEKNIASPAAVSLLAKSGCKVLVNGIESGSQEVSNLMRKGIDLKRAESYVRECHAEGVRTGWMFFIGFPGETEAQARETFEFIERNANYLDYASVGVFGLERGSPLWEAPKDNGIIQVLDKNRPYPTNFDFIFRDGTLVTSKLLVNRLRQLHADFPHLKSIFSDAIDRSFVMFFPKKPSTKSTTQQTMQQSYIYQWESKLTNSKARLNLKQRRIEVLSSAS